MTDFLFLTHEETAVVSAVFRHLILPSCCAFLHASPGLFLASQPKVFPCGIINAAWTLACRFALVPLLTALFGLALGLRGTMLHIATVQVNKTLSDECCYVTSCCMLGLYVHTQRLE